MTDAAPRLRIERLAIVESRTPTLKFIRDDIHLHAGLNIVWAQELAAAEGATHVERAGHGVGKSTFCLMLRAVLGDDGVAVKTMRGHLAEHFGSGGIAAEVLAGGERFAVFRAFGLHSFALKNGTVESLFAESAKDHALDFSTYVTALGEAACTRYLPTRALPVTGQAVEWGHILCWLARDQALGLRQYFEWRNDDGTGLRRKAKDPPALVRLSLGLLTDAEATAEDEITRMGGEISKAREMLKAEEQRGANTRGIVESQLRQWASVSESLQMFSDDLFADSVERQIQRKSRDLEAKNDQTRTTIEALEREVVELTAAIHAHTPVVQLARDRWQESVALRTNDEKSLREIRERRDKLLTLSGTCQYGAVAYQDCVHVQQERNTISLKAQRDVGVLSKTVDHHQEREQAEKADYDREAKTLGELTSARDKKIASRIELARAIEARMRLLGRRDAIRETLTQWQEDNRTPETERLRAARAAVGEFELKLEAAKNKKLAAQQQVSDREQQISERMSALAAAFGAQARYVPSEEKRPFQMIGADGDAYTVLEILLGDIACALDGTESAGAHPGLLILDCPREREMSPHLYDRFLKLVDELSRRTPGLQVIITTTTPPPEPFRDPPTCILKLSRASAGDLLLKRRIKNLLSRTTSSLPEDQGETT